MKLQSRIFVAGICGLVGLAGPRAAHAQVAIVTSVERVVEKRTGGAGAFTTIKSGASLEQGDAVRTGKRSKAEIRFEGDNSLLRLGQLSAVQIQGSGAGGTRIRVHDGRIIFITEPSKPTIRVLAAMSGADIKGNDKDTTGSTSIIQADSDGGAEYSLYSGAMTVYGLDADGQQTNQVVLPVNHSVRVAPDGTISEIRRAKPLPQETKN